MSGGIAETFIKDILIEASTRLKKEALRREFVPGRVGEVRAEEKSGLERELLGGKEHT